MPIDDEYRRELHRMLDAILDELEVEHHKSTGVLILREVIVSRGNEVDRHLLLRGVLGKHADMLRELAKSIKGG